MARTRYGFENVFRLGEEVLGRIRANRAPTKLLPHDVTPPPLELRRIPEIGLGLLLVFPAAVVLVIGHFLTEVPGWTWGTGRAFMLGVTLSMVITNAVLFGIVRRSSLLIGCGRWRGARRFLWWMSWVTALTLLTGEAIGLFIAGQVGTVQGSELTTFALSFSGLAVFWIISGGFVVLGRSHEPGMAVLVGVGIGLLVDRVLASGSPRHLDIAILVAYLTVLCLIGARVVYLLTSDRGGPDSYQRPRSSYVIDEALPYFAYGGLLIALILAPIVLTAFVGTSRSTSIADLSTVEVGMTLALFPLMISLFAADDAVRKLWETMCRTFSATALGDSAAVSIELYRWHSIRRLRFLVRVAIISALCIPVIWFLADTNAFRAIGVNSRGLFVATFVVSLLSYLMLASAQFDSVIALTLARPRVAVRSLAIGVLVAVVVAAATFALDYSEVGLVAMFAGTAVFGVIANLSARRFFRDVPFHFVSSM